MTPWAYRDELPKHEVGGLTGWEQAALLGVMVDEKEDRTDYECKLPIALGPPHPDALLLDWIRESSQVVRTAAPLGALLPNAAHCVPLERSART